MTENNDTQSSGLPAWLKPWFDYRRKRCWLLIAVVAYTLLGFFAAPWAVEKVLKGQMEDVGRSASMTETRMNPYLLTLEMKGLEIRDTDSEPLVAFDRLFVDFETRSLIDWALNFKRIELNQLNLFEERFEGTDTRLVRFLADLSATEEVSPEEADEPPPRAIVQELRIRNASVRVIDGPADQFTYTLGPITVDVDDVRTLPDHAGRQAVSIQINETDTLRWSGDIQIVPFRTTGQVSFEGNELPNTRIYLDYYLPLDVEFTGIDFRFAYEAEVTEAGLGLKLADIEGNLRDLGLSADEDDEVLVRVTRTDWSGGTFDLLGERASMAQVDVTGFHGKVVLREDGSLNLLDLVPPTDPAGDSAPESSGSGSSAADGLDLSSITNGTVFFNAGQTSQTITVSVSGDTNVEADETLSVTLVSASL